MIIYFQMLKGVNWYTERSISEISLGGLLILVVIRTIQYNMFKMRVNIYKNKYKYNKKLIYNYIIKYFFNFLG